MMSKTKRLIDEQEAACQRHESNLTQSLCCGIFTKAAWLMLFSLQIAISQFSTLADASVVGLEVQLLQKTKAEMFGSTNFLVLKRLGKTNRLDYGTQKSLITEDGRESAIELFHREKVYVRSRNFAFRNEAVDKNAFAGTNTVRALDTDAREIGWTNQTETGAVTLVDPHKVPGIIRIEEGLPHFPLANRLQVPGTIVGKQMVVQSRVSRTVNLAPNMLGGQNLIVTMELNFLSATNKAFEKSEFDVPKDYIEVQIPPDDPSNARPLPPPAGIISKEQMESRINEIKRGAPVLKATGTTAH